MPSIFQAPEPLCTSSLVLSYESRERCGKAVALVWDTGEMKAVDNKNLTQLESTASVLPAQKGVLFWVYMSMCKSQPLSEGTGTDGLREKQLPHKQRSKS